MTHDKDIAERSAALVTQLTAAGITVSTAESCTGGWIAKAITDVPGSSAVIGYGMVSYSNDAKMSLLDVQAATLDAHGAVSAAVVEEMAGGALRLSGADLAVSVSGIAGPDGGSPEKPTGTVWFGWARWEGSSMLIETDRQLFAGDRDAVRAQTVIHALQGLARRVSA
jgi:nicotinamide-nucleotide amidase